MQNRVATIESPLAQGPLQIPASSIRVIELRSLVPEARTYLREVLDQQPTGDAVIVQKGDPPRFDHLSGILGDVDEQAVSFDWDDEPLVIKRTKLAAILYYQQKDEDDDKERWILKTISGATLRPESIELDPIAASVRRGIGGGLSPAGARGERGDCRFLL